MGGARDPPRPPPGYATGYYVYKNGRKCLVLFSVLLSVIVSIRLEKLIDKCSH